jgi:hypothetical protein
MSLWLHQIQLDFMIQYCIELIELQEKQEETAALIRRAVVYPGIEWDSAYLAETALCEN